jgi:hypothetical protein
LQVIQRPRRTIPSHSIASIRRVGSSVVVVVHWPIWRSRSGRSARRVAVAVRVRVVVLHGLSGMRDGTDEHEHEHERGRRRR